MTGLGSMGRPGGASLASPTLQATLSALSLTANLKAHVDTLVGRSTFPTNTIQRPVTQTGSAETWYEIYKPNAQPAWADAIHKDSAQFTLLLWAYIGSTSNTAFMGSDGGAVGIGFRWGLQPTSLVPRITISGAGGAAISGPFTGDTGANNNAWNFLAVSIDETSGTGGRMYLNGAVNQVSGSNTFNPTYTGPSASAAVSVLEIGAWGNGNTALPSGSLIACAAIIQGATLTNGNLDSIWSAMRARFGL